MLYELTSRCGGDRASEHELPKSPDFPAAGQDLLLSAFNWAASLQCTAPCNPPETDRPWVPAADA